jgi:hypothetical protein
MVVCLSVKTATLERVFSYNGPDPDLWLRAIKRVLTDPQNKAEQLTTYIQLPDENFLVGRGEWRRLRDRVRLSNYFIEIERVVQQVSSGQWNDLDLGFFARDHFKTSVRLIWSAVTDFLRLESTILDCLYQEGNGGLRVESILSRLLAAGVLARFAVVRDALGHLCKLCLVEHAYGQFSIRDGMLGDKAFKCLTV